MVDAADEDGPTKVNVRVPMQLLRAGVKLTSIIPPRARDEVNAALAIAPFIGSFLAVVTIRMAGARSIVAGRSACDACGRVLGPAELIPLLSFVVQCGRCRRCRAPIDPLHPIMEIGALAIAMWAVIVTSGWIIAASCLLGWTLLTLAAIDCRTGLLPDVLTLPLIGAGLLTTYLIDGPSCCAQGAKYHNTRWPFQAREIDAALHWASLDLIRAFARTIVNVRAAV